MPQTKVQEWTAAKVAAAAMYGATNIRPVDATEHRALIQAALLRSKEARCTGS